MSISVSHFYYANINNVKGLLLYNWFLLGLRRKRNDSVEA